MATKCSNCKGTGNVDQLFGHKDTPGGRIPCSKCNGTGTILDGTGCFHPDTIVATAIGNIPILEVRRGAQVYGGVLGPNLRAGNTVVNVRTYKDRFLLRIDLEGGRKSVRVTSRHAFLTTCGWKWAKNLKAGDDIVLMDEGTQFQSSKVRSIQQLEYTPIVYNLIVSGDGSYMADGLVVSSYSVLRTPRLWALNRYIALTHAFSATSKGLRQPL